MNSTTASTQARDIIRTWHIFDVKGQVLGRIATQIAHALMGKDKPNFVRHLDCGNHVVVINASHVVVTGKKETDKLYTNYSGFPGGLKTKALWQVRAEKPTKIVRSAIYGMLPKNKLRDRLVTRLWIYAQADHPYGDKFQKSDG